MASVLLNIGDKLSFDANDSPSTSQNTTYLRNPSANPDNAINVFVANVQTANFGQGVLEVFSAGSGAGDVVADGNFKFADAGGRQFRRTIHCMQFLNVAEVSANSEVIYYESDTVATAPYYLRMKDQSSFRAQAVVPLSLPDGSTITGFDMQYRKVAQAASKSRNMQANLARFPGWATSGGMTNIGTALDVTNGNGSTENGTKTQSGLSTVVDNDLYSYGILVNIHNDDTGNDGADGIGCIAFRLTFKVTTLGG